MEKFLQELDLLDREIVAMLQGLTSRTIMVSHPAYAYFCRDYDLEQLPIEFEGKDPTPKQLTRVLQQAREFKIGKIFIQAQHSGKGARLLAKEIGADVVVLDPLGENYLENMRTIARHFSEHRQEMPSALH